MKKISKVIFQIILGLVLVGLIILVVRLRPGSEAISPGSPSAYPGSGETDAGDSSSVRGTEAPYPPPGQEETQWVENSKPILPSCVFPLTPIEESGPIDAPAVSQFSEPQIVYTSATGIGIAEWLPDGETLLLTRETTYGKQIIETFNTRTGESHIYAERHYAGGKPIWLEELNAVAFTTFVQDHEELWISYGDPNQTEQLFSDIFTLSLEKMGGQLLFFSPSRGDQPLSLDLQSKSTLDFEISLEDLAYSRFPPGIRSTIPGYTYQLASQPSGKNIVFYGGGLFYVANIETRAVCEIEIKTINDVPISAFSANWSENGRYLALITSPYIPGTKLPFSNVTVLDFFTGKLTKIANEAQYINDMDWINNQYLLIMGQDKTEYRNGRSLSKVYLADIVNPDQSLPISNTLFGGGATNGWELAVSSGGKIAVKCPLWLEEKPQVFEDHICIIDVTKNN